MPCLCKVSFTRVMHPWLLQLVVFRLSCWSPLLLRVETLESLLPLHIIFLHSPLTFFLRLSDPRCLLLSPETALRTDLTSSSASMQQSVYLLRSFCVAETCQVGSALRFCGSTVFSFWLWATSRALNQTTSFQTQNKVCVSMHKNHTVVFISYLQHLGCVHWRSW